MLRNLVIIHRTSPTAFEPSLEADFVAHGGVLWETCLRRILIGNAAALSGVPVEVADEVYTEKMAYGFLLEVLSGLHSKVLGENEIVGQFKRRFLHSEVPETFRQTFDRLPQMLLSDMKRVRSELPLNLGNHSYGSFVRGVLSKRSPALRLSVVGTGELAKAILPWILTPTDRVNVYYHSEKGRENLEEALDREMKVSQSSISFSPLTEGVSELTDALILAAPMRACELRNAILPPAKHGEVFPSLVFDFRADCETDPLLIPGEVITLNDFFLQARAVDAAGEVRRKKAVHLIGALSDSRLETESIQIRTQGWEDLCG